MPGMRWRSVGTSKGKRPSGRKAIDPKRAQLLRKVALHLAIALIFLGGLGAGFYYLQDYVKKEVAGIVEPTTIVIRNRPHWMSDFLVEKIAQTARPAGGRSAFDRQMLVDARAALEKNPWISKVHEVRRAYGRKPGDVLEIDCEYRVPVALVRWGEYYWLVDRNG